MRLSINADDLALVINIVKEEVERIEYLDERENEPYLRQLKGLLINLLK